MHQCIFYTLFCTVSHSMVILNSGENNTYALLVIIMNVPIGMLSTLSTAAYGTMLHEFRILVAVTSIATVSSSTMDVDLFIIFSTDTPSAEHTLSLRSIYAGSRHTATTPCPLLSSYWVPVQLSYLSASSIC